MDKTIQWAGRWGVLQVFWVIAVVWASSAPSDIENPRARNAWVSDTAAVIDADTESRMNARIERLNQSTGVEIAVVTVKDVAGTPKGFTTKLFNLWGVGDAEMNNGLLIVLVMDQRRLEMEPGYGLEGVLTDGWLGTMQSKKMVPHFKQGDHAKGLEAGLVAVEARLTGSGDVSTSSGGPGERSADGGSGRRSLVFFGTSFVGLVVLIAAPLVIGMFVVLWIRRRKERLCPECKIDTVLLDEVADDAHLDEGQIAEEEFKSVDWRVRVCGQCQGIRIFSSARWFSGFVRCSGCGYKTGKESRITLDPATYTSVGTGEVCLFCMHCDHESVRTFVIPVRVRSSSSGGGFSSGGGGSFGGGSSGGGGAGSSW